MPVAFDLAVIPDEPGSYQFRAQDGRVLYVGKAKRLRQRLGSYASGAVDARVSRMLQEADDLSWVVVANETEALLLEARLIATHQPPYNIRLRHDDTYPSIELTSGPVPRMRITRVAGRKSRRFGPFPGAGEARLLMEAISRAWGVRPCSDRKLSYHQKLARPCLLGPIGKCAAPCMDQEGYDLRVEGAVRLLRGDATETVGRLEALMRRSAGAERFEEAAKLRDLSSALQRRSDARVVEGKGQDTDVWATATDEFGGTAQLLVVRQGSIVAAPALLVASGVGTTALDKETVGALSLEAADSARVLVRAMLDYYAEGVEIPARIALSTSVDDAGLLEETLAGKRGGMVKLWVPSRGRFAELVRVAGRNAEEALLRARLRRATDGDARRAELSALAEGIGLDEAPLRIECFDISHLRGRGTVAGMSVLDEGLPRRGAYRRWRLKEWNGDDYGAMGEVLRRRFARLDSKDQSGFSSPPGLLLIDGGLGQLAVAVSVLDELGLTDRVPVASLAKRLEEVWRPGADEPVRLGPDSPALWVLQRARDEAHRTAVTFQRKQRPVPADPLAGVEGLGPKRRERLLKEFGGAAGVRRATRRELDDLGWLGGSVTAALWDKLHPETSGSCSS